MLYTFICSHFIFRLIQNLSSKPPAPPPLIINHPQLPSTPNVLERWDTTEEVDENMFVKSIFIERELDSVKGSFPFQSNDNDKGPYNHDQIC